MLIYCENDGFTLVEVLVASVILFSAIAVGTLAYRTSIISVDSVIANVRIADALPSIIEIVKKEVMAHKDKGHGPYSGRISYFFKVNQTTSSRNILGLSDEIAGGFDYGTYNMALKDIHLIIRFQDELHPKEAVYDYKELIWSKVE